MKRKSVIRQIALLVCCSTLFAGCGGAAPLPEEAGEKTLQQTEVTEEVLKSEEPSQQDDKPDFSQANFPVDIKNEVVDLSTEERIQKAVYFADQIARTNQNNTIVSPISLEFALGMLAEGASGETARQLWGYLGGESYSDYARRYMEYAKWLEVTPNMSGGEALENHFYTFSYQIANSLWINEKQELQATFRDSVTKKYDAAVEKVDFVKDKEKTTEQINAWVNDKTRGMIPGIVTEEQLGESLAAILMNTVYFESPWQSEWGTCNHNFTNPDGTITAQEMLAGKLGMYYENTYATAFSKSYYNGFRFVGILPKVEGDFDLMDLDIAGLLASGTTDYDVDAIVPKLNFETTAASIPEMLAGMGVDRLFDPGAAEFDRMIETGSTESNFYVSDILQKCKIEMDEHGTRAAAVTEVLMKDSCAMPEMREVKQVHLDRPFAFLIYDDRNEEVVFIGKVTNL